MLGLLGVGAGANFYAPTWTLSPGGIWVNNPRLESNLLIDGDMELAGTAYYPPSGAPSPYEKSAIQKYNGAQSLRSVSVALYEGFTQSANGVLANNWYKYSGQQFLVSGNSRLNYQDWRGWSHSISSYPGATGQWVFVSGSAMATANNAPLEGISIAIGTEIFYDALTLQRIDAPSLFATRESYRSDFNLIAPALSILTQYKFCNPAGIVLCLDNPYNPLNMILAFLDGVTNAKIAKIINGVWSTIATVAVTVASNKFFSAKKNGSTVNIYYDTVAYSNLLTSATVADSQIVNNTRHGLISTDQGNVFTGNLSIFPYS